MDGYTDYIIAMLCYKQYSHNFGHFDTMGASFEQGWKSGGRRSLELLALESLQYYWAHIDAGACDQNTNWRDYRL